MRIRKVKVSSYNNVSSATLYDYIQKYLAEISRMIEPEEVKTVDEYKAKVAQMEKTNRACLKACAADLENVKRRLEYYLYGRY